MDKKARIEVAFFLPSLEPGGTERNVVNLANAIDVTKYNVSLVLGIKEGDFLGQINAHIPIIDLGASHSIPLFFKLVDYLRAGKPDVLISSFPRINIICILAKFFSGAPTKIIITEHSVFSLLPVIAKTFWRRSFAYFFMPVLAKFLYPHTSAIVCVSRGIADDLAAILHISNSITIINNPVVSEEVYLLAERPVSHPWFLESNIPVIIAAGRLVACKDYPTLLSAFKLVAEKMPARLVILGRGPEEKKLQNLSRDLGISKYVAFLGFVENPYSYMKKSTLFVLSSLQEGFGNVIIEAMACGIPVISTDCPAGPREIISSGINGLLVPVGDYLSLAKNMVNILTDAALREKVSDGGKKRAQDFYVSTSAKKYEELFEAVMIS